MSREYLSYAQSIETSHGRRKFVPKSLVERQQSFIVWSEIKLEVDGKVGSFLWRLASGPRFEVKTFHKYRINGYIFSPKHYGNTVITQDSGVCFTGITTFQASRKDKIPKDAPTMWYGIIKEIMELDYTMFQKVVFYCDWVKVEDKSNSCKLNPDSSLLLVNLNNLQSNSRELDELVILASYVSRVFYLKDLKNPDWWVVVRSLKRLTSRVDELEVLDVFSSIVVDEPHLEHLMKQAC